MRIQYRGKTWLGKETRFSNLPFLCKCCTTLALLLKMGEHMEIDVKEHAEDVLKKFNGFREHGRLCDLIIKVGNEKFNAHKDVVCASSEYFNDKVSDQNSYVEVNEEGADVQCVKKCVDFMYTAKVCVPQGKCKDMMRVATLLELHGLRNAISCSLQDSLNVDSFFATKDIASTYNCDSLENECKSFAMKNFCKISVKEGFKKLRKEYVSSLIQSSETKASDSAKCKALIVWARANRNESKKFIEEMLQHLNLEKIPLGYQRLLIEEETLVFSSEACLKTLLLSIMDKANVVAKDFAIEDDEMDNALTMFDKASKSVQVFEPELKRWTRKQEIPDEINKVPFTAVKLEESIYTLSNNGTGHQLEYANTAAPWIRTPGRINTTGRAAAVVVDGSLYSVDNSSSSSVAIERLDHDNNTWVHVIDKEKPHNESAVFAYEGSLYCVGGTGAAARYMADFEKLNLDPDPFDLSWFGLTPMPTARYGAAAVVLKGKLYVMGGYNGNYLRVVESYDFQSANWEAVSDMNHPRYQFSACVLDGKIYAIGGVKSNNTIEVFDPRANAWNIVETMVGKDIQAEAVVATHWLT